MATRRIYEKHEITIGEENWKAAQIQILIHSRQRRTWGARRSPPTQSKTEKGGAEGARRPPPTPPEPKTDKDQHEGARRSPHTPPEFLSAAEDAEQSARHSGRYKLNGLFKGIGPDEPKRNEGTIPR